MSDGGLDAEQLRAQAAKCLKLAKQITDEEAIAALRNLAMVYQGRARRIEEG
jgi:hypothetical protein